MCKNMFRFFWGHEDIFHGSKEFVPYFYNHNKNLYNKFEFLENYCIYTKKLC